MTQYLISFNQQWVGDHTAEWFASRGPLARAVVADMRDAGVLVFAEGLEEEPELAIRFEPNDGSPTAEAGPFAGEFMGGLTIINVDTLDEAKVWAGRIAEACGWTQELRPFKR